MLKISFHWLFFPGMIFHELSHYAACLFLGVNVRKVKLFGVNEAFVVHDRPNAWKSVIIALAPFLLGNFFALIFIAFGFSLLFVLNPFGLVFLWFALSLLFYSFPSLHDSKNAFDSVAGFYSRKIFRGNLFKRIFWLITFPFVFIPLILILGVMLAFNYSSKLRLLWMLLIIVFSLYPPYSERFLSYINDLVSTTARFLFGWMQLISGAVNYLMKEKIKANEKPSILGIGSTRVLTPNPAFTRLRHLRERRVF